MALFYNKKPNTVLFTDELESDTENKIKTRVKHAFNGKNGGNMHL